MTIPPKSSQALHAMRDGGRLLHDILQKTNDFIQAGQSLKEIDTHIHRLILEREGKPSFLGYKNYPAASCLSVNDAVVHGIPSDYILEEGDILGVDVGMHYQGYHTDAAFTKGIGKISQDRQNLLNVTQEALRIGIEATKAGNTVGDIGREIEAYIRSQGNYGIVRDLSGHGVGEKLQELPEILNYTVKDATPLVNNMTVAIEPMVTLGGWEVLIDSDDKWTIVTADGSAAAHFETTIIIRDNDPEILVPFPLDYRYA